MKTMFRIKLLIAFFILAIMPKLSFSQIIEPVKWEVIAEEISDGNIEITLTGVIESGWYIYGLGPYLNGPNPTEVKVLKSEDLTTVKKLTLKTKESKKFDDAFQMEIGYFKKLVEFTAKVKEGKNPIFTGMVSWQACNEGSCIAPAEFEFNVDFSDIIRKPSKESTVTDTPAKKDSIPVAASNVQTALNVDSNITNSTDNKSVASTVNTGDWAAEKDENRSLWGFFFLAFVAGLAAIVTPCVFPMIPMTVSFFIKDTKKGKTLAMIFGGSIIAIYTLIGTLLAVLLGPDFANWLSTHWIPNIFFFLIFIIFAFSFFGMFEIVLPSSLLNKTDKQADKGGFVGAIFMAVTLVLVSFSCTGPIVGTILVESAGGEILKPIIGMGGFALAFALPFTFFALFPKLLKNLPKSGGWLNTVKVVLGFLELALGLKFLSIADQTYHWGILDREVYLALWIVIFTLLGLYLLGKLRFNHDSPSEHISVPKLVLAIISFSFVVYMFPGMFGAPLKALSGYLPPQATHDFDLVKISRNKSSGTGNSTELPPRKFTDILHLPHGLEGFFDYNEALAYSKKIKKPIFIDFTGHGCVNCREMEARVWSDSRVLKMLKEDFIILALYVDDKTELQESDWITTPNGKILKTIGKQNAYFQTVKTQSNSQPNYLIIDGDEKLLTEPKGYDLNPDNFVEFLKKGINSYR